MGNCLRTNKISSQDHENYAIKPNVEERETFPMSKLVAPRKEQSMKKKVRFSIQNDIDEGDNRGCHGNYARCGSVRIRVVMTQEELKRMLRCKDDAQHTSLEQLLGAVKLRGGRISEVGEYHDEGINSWKPTLKSIPEDRLINI